MKTYFIIAAMLFLGACSSLEHRPASDAPEMAPVFERFR